MSVLKLKSSEFNDKVLGSDKPVLLDFFATWCGPCRMLSPIVEQIAEEKVGELTVYKVDVDEEGELASQFSISVIPTLVCVEGGKVKFSMTGYRQKAEILDKIEE